MSAATGLFLPETYNNGGQNKICPDLKITFSPPSKERMMVYTSVGGRIDSIDWNNSQDIQKSCSYPLRFVVQQCGKCAQINTEDLFGCILLEVVRNEVIWMRQR